MKYISPEDLNQLMKKDQDFQLIDVRESYEYEDMNIGGDNIPLAELIDAKDRISRDKRVVLCCKTGKRSAAMSLTLERKFGLDNIYTLKGGLESYLETVK